MPSKPRIADLIDVLEEMAPSRDSREWDNPGLQAGDPSRETDRILISLDPTPHAVGEAANRKAQVLLSHHPLLFRPLSCLNQATYPGNVLYQALAAGVSLIAAHTNLDAAPGGLNDMLADLLSLVQVQALQEIQGPETRQAPLGRIGFFPQPMTLSAAAQVVKKTLSADRVRVVGSTASTVRRVAVVTGSGGSMIQLASRMGADLLVTGDVTYHQALEALYAGIALIDAGHFQAERAALVPFADRLRSAMAGRRWEVLVEIYEDERDPFHYE